MQRCVLRQQAAPVHHVLHSAPIGGAIRQPAAALRTTWRAQILCDSSAVCTIPRPPAGTMGWRRSGWTEIKCRASGWDGAVNTDFREEFSSPVKASAATRPSYFQTSPSLRRSSRGAPDVADDRSSRIQYWTPWISIGANTRTQRRAANGT